MTKNLAIANLLTADMAIIITVITLVFMTGMISANMKAYSNYSQQTNHEVSVNTQLSKEEVQQRLSEKYGLGLQNDLGI